MLPTTTRTGLGWSVRLWVAGLWLRFLFFIAAVFIFAGQSAFALAAAHVAHGFIQGAVGAEVFVSGHGTRYVRREFQTRAEARAAFFEWIEVFYRERLYSTLDFQSPVDFENQIN